MHRRTFVQTLSATLLAPAVACASAGAGGAAGTAAVPGQRRLSRIGVQLYTLRDAARANLDRTLGDIATAGYKYVELLMSNNNFNTPAKVVRVMLERHGLQSPSTHIGVSTVENFERAVAVADALGHRYFILADLPAEGRRSLDTFREWADRLNRAGEVARKNNLWLAWHDEADDFKTFDGVMGYDALVEKLDPSLVRLQLDTGNAMLGGRDPLDLMNRYGDRYYSFHIKDAPALRAPHDVDLGKGVVDLKGILSRVKDIDEKYFYVEQESYEGSPLAAVERDYDYLSKLTF